MKTELPTIGKMSSEIFDEIILPQLGRKRPEILVGPRHGVDVGVVDLGNGKVMVATTDPIFVVPPTGGSVPAGSRSTSSPPTRPRRGSGRTTSPWT